MGRRARCLILSLTVVLLTAGQVFQVPSLYGAQSGKDLWSRGYALLPQPQKVSLESGNFTLGADWQLELLQSVPEQHMAVKTLLDRLGREFGIRLARPGGGQSTGKKIIQLEIRPGCTAQGKKESIANQAYLLELKPEKITICGNGDAGLFYGVQTLLQLLSSKKNLQLPVCRIEDWPDLELREIHWDSQYHHDRFETFKEYLDRAAEYKINAVGYSIKDKFAYPSHPIIGAPGAFTTQQVQELVRYAQERYIEITPLVQVPSHMSYVLKHPQFAHLREDILNNFQICTSNEESWKLMFDMFDDMLEATPGCKYFHVGTDESWFYGTGKDCPCVEKLKKEGKSGLFVEFMLRACKYLEDRGRVPRFWGEYPLDIQDTPKLPNTLIDAVAGRDSEEIAIEKAHGMRLMIYTSVGARIFFPQYFGQQRGKPAVNSGPLENCLREIATGPARKGIVLGTFTAAWDESDPHMETFWLAWVGCSSYGWNPGVPGIDDMLNQFMVLFYGPDNLDMLEAYHLLNKDVGFWSSSWERTPTLKELNYGGSYGPRPSPIGGQYIELPHLPDPQTLFNHPFWKDRYSSMPAFRALLGKDTDSLDIYKELAEGTTSNDRIVQLLTGNLQKASRNKYNIEVLLSITQYWRHNIKLFETLARIEDTLSVASRAREYHQYDKAIACLMDAEKLAEGICQDREKSYNQLVRVWEKSRYPKGQSVDGRKYVHIESNTWSGGANRTPDMSFIVKRERDINLEKWICDLKGIRQTFALEHQFEIPADLLYPNTN